MKRNNRDTILKVSAFILALVLVLSVLVIITEKLDITDITTLHDPYSTGEIIRYNGKEYVRRDDVETMLVLGLDTFDKNEDVDSKAYTNDKKADFIMLVVSDYENDKCVALQINRDTMANVNILGVLGDKISTEKKQITTAHCYGNGGKASSLNVADSVSDLLYGVSIKNFVSLTMDSVAEYTDLLDGVEVQVEDDFSKIDDTLKQGEKTVLRGNHALTFVRSRYAMEDASNENRMARQREYLNSARKKTAEKLNSDSEFITDTYLKMSDYMTTDCTASTLQKWFEKIANNDNIEIKKLEGNYIKGAEYMEFYPDEENLKKTIIELFYKKK